MESSYLKTIQRAHFESAFKELAGTALTGHFLKKICQ